jgi:hypothetical protein
VGLFVELQKRIPDRWLLRRLLPATLFVAVAVVGAGQLGQSHWNDIGLARARIAGALQLNGGASASLVLTAVAVVACALAIPVAANVISALTSSTWPWWLMPIGRRITARRARRWAPVEEIAKQAVRARADGRLRRGDRLDARKARSSAFRPESPTWSGDRLRATETRVRDRTGLDIATEWTRLLLVIPDTARTALTNAREAYDAACEAVVWGLALTILGAWWWPAAVIGLVSWLTAWRWLRDAVDSLCQTGEAVFVMYRDILP